MKRKDINDFGTLNADSFGTSGGSSFTSACPDGYVLIGYDKKGYPICEPEKPDPSGSSIQGDQYSCPDGYEFLGYDPDTGKPICQAIDDPEDPQTGQYGCPDGYFCQELDKYGNCICVPISEIDPGKIGGDITGSGEDDPILLEDEEDPEKEAAKPGGGGGGFLSDIKKKLKTGKSKKGYEFLGYIYGPVHLAGIVGGMIAGGVIGSRRGNAGIGVFAGLVAGLSLSVIAKKPEKK